MGNAQVKALILSRLETLPFILKALLVWKALPEGTRWEPGPGVPALASFGVTAAGGCPSPAAGGSPSTVYPPFAHPKGRVLTDP